MPWGATVSLSSGYHPQSNGQLVWANQSLESALRCVSAHHPVSWSTFLPWVENVHDSHVSTTGMSPFMASLVTNRLFDVQEDEVAVPSVQFPVWQQVHSALLRSSRQSQRKATQCRVPVPPYHPG